VLKENDYNDGNLNITAISPGRSPLELKVICNYPKGYK
jgi:hypothetical protein